MYEASVSGRPPREIGTQHGSPAAVTTLRANPISITGPFQGRIEITLDIDTNGAASLQEFDLEVAATLIMDD